MEDAIARLLDRYATVADGSSALLRSDFLTLIQQHAVSEPHFCDAFAQELVSRFASGDLDADRAAFAADDLHAAADFTLPSFARRVFALLEYGESSPTEARQLLEGYGPGSAA
ncbi:hypothetical protein LDO26_12640 [Luteimonas sp. BDR2-5]|uniref:hypothetical protein n=1 Tax=Proluteimonas luteida TaxID=2878685 RepID=UPI001E5FA3F8|nr:hypothetical protein [Luteimonas sp. BDR2-5]MCD9029048.1 hypothetical protein [Luteimonas sp. BDR2-5]